VSILEVAQRVKLLTDSESEIVFVPYDEAYTEGFEDMPRRVPDVSKVSGLVGFGPTKDLDGILQEVIYFYSRNEPERLRLNGRQAVSSEAAATGGNGATGIAYAANPGATEITGSVGL
jgi:hypothetical protein